MKKLWCWRCRMEIPMLDEAEFQKAYELYGEGFRNRSISLVNKQERFKSLLDFYYDLTGFKETEPNAIMHHRIVYYGSPCEKCNKPYRTPKALFCVACGNKKTK